MTKRRKFLLGMGSLAAGGAAAMGSGAFTSVSANRGVTVSVASDSDALLAFDTSNAGPNSDYAENTNSGTLRIDIGSQDGDPASDAGAAGINQNATTIIRDMFDIRNQGTQPVFVWQETNADDGDSNASDQGPDFGLFADYPAHAEPDASAQPSSGPVEPTTGLGEGKTGADAISYPGGNIGSAIPERIYLEPGDSLREVGTYFSGSNLQDINGDITLKAVAVSSTEATVDTNYPGSFVKVNDPTP